MSSGGQVVGGLVGAVAGFFVGGPTAALYGAQIGIMAGGYLDPPKGPTVNGPRLEDLTVQTSTYGAVIPRLYGTITVNGNVIWLENNQLRETVTKTKSGGKGGGSKTTTKTYTYSATFAVGLVDTRSTGGPITGVRRIWIGADLYYDAGSDDFETIAASNDVATGFAVYDGSDTQDPDPRIQADIGAGGVPAWRGVAYLVFYDLPLERYGNSLMGAQVRAEIVANGTPDIWPYTIRTMPNQVNYGRTAWNGAIYCSFGSATTKCHTSPDGITWTEHDLGATYTCWSLIAVGNVFYAACSFYILRSEDGIAWTQVTPYRPHYYTAIAWSGSKFLVAADSQPWLSSTDGITWVQQTAPGTVLGLGAGSYGRTLAWNGSVFVTMTKFGGLRILTSPDGDSWTHTFTAGGGGWEEIAVLGTRFCLTSNGQYLVLVSDDGVVWDMYAMPSNHVNSICAGDGLFFCTDQGQYHISADGINWDSYSFPYAGVTYGGAAWNGAWFAVTSPSPSARALTVKPRDLDINTVTLGSIVSSESLQSGLLTAGDIDVSALTQAVRGYRVSTVGAIRGAIEQLQAAWPFDVVQHGYAIRFVARGGASVVTIPAADLDARDGSAEPGVQITTSREMDSQLPARVTIKHFDFDREYDTGEQYAARLNTSAINVVALDLPIVLTATEAAGKAEVLLYLYWLERYDVAIALPPTYNSLEPGDVVTLTTPEGLVSLRLTAIHYTSDGRLECSAKYASAAIYAPTAVGSAGVSTGSVTIPRAGPSRYELLDIPLIHSAQADAGFLAAMTGSLAGWPGGALLASSDGGANWTTQQDFSRPGGVLGIASTALADADARMLDKAGLLTVNVMTGALYDTTELAMLGGENTFAYGADGRWEILSARLCTLQSGSIYLLSDFRRGMFGTEWASGLHDVGDALVLLDADDVAYIALSSAAIGQARLYRGITSGQDIGSAPSRTFAYQGVNLKPLSPIALTGNRSPSTNDWTLSWIRRTRSGGEWRDLVDADLGESSERYEIDIYTTSGYTTVKRTLTATSQSATYTSAEQVTDFGSNQATLYLKVYQMSSAVGRGYPLTQSLTR